MPGRNERGDVADGAGRRGRAGRSRVPVRRQPPQPDRGADHDRGLGRRPAHPLRLDHGHHGRAAHRRRSCSACPPAKIRVLTQFVGGAFGSKAMVWPHVTLTAMAARHVGRPVRLMLTRAADVHLERPPRGAGAAHRARRDPRRPADRDPARQALDHLAVRRLGRARDRRLVAALRLPQLRGRPPADPRQHDDADVHPRRRARRVGVFTLECAMDELAGSLGIDPVELRLRNHDRRSTRHRQPLVQ